MRKNYVRGTPIGFEGQDENLRSYISNNSLNATDPTGQIKWEGAATFKYFAGLYISSKIYLDFHATASDECFDYKISFHGYLGGHTGAMIQGGGYFVVASQFSNVEAPAEWPVNLGDKADYASIGITIGFAPLSVQSFHVGQLNWTDFLASGGWGVETFGGGAFGDIDHGLMRSKARRLAPPCIGDNSVDKGM
jgi:hypothetical protein